MPKSQWDSGTTQPQYALYVDQVGGSRGRLGQRLDNFTYDFIEKYSLQWRTYHHIKIVKNGTNVNIFIDNELKTSQTLSWIDDYQDYCMSMMRWTSPGTSKLRNVKIKTL